VRTVTVAILILVLILVPAPEEPTSRVDIGVDDEAARASGEFLACDPSHDDVVDLVVGANAHDGHEILFNHAPGIVADVGPGEGDSRDDEEEGNVDVEVDAEVCLDGRRKDTKAGDEKVEKSERDLRLESYVRDSQAGTRGVDVIHDERS
jgi:hypothetical protein